MNEKIVNLDYGTVVLYRDDEYHLQFGLIGDFGQTEKDHVWVERIDKTPTIIFTGDIVRAW